MTILPLALGALILGIAIAMRRAALGRVARARTPAPRCVRCGVEQFEWPLFVSDDEMQRLRCPSGRGHFFTDDRAVAAMISASEPALDHALNIVFDDGPLRRLHPGRVYDSAPTLSVLEAALAEGRDVFAGPDGAIVTAPLGTLTKPPDGFRPMGFMELRDRIEITRRTERESVDERWIREAHAELAEQELARRRAQAGGDAA